MKTLSEEYKDCKGKSSIYCDVCDDRRMKRVITYACGEVISSWCGMGKCCIECGSSSYKIGGSVR